MTVKSQFSDGTFLCTLECDECGAEIKPREWHSHDNETGESFCDDCRSTGRDPVREPAPWRGQ